MTERRGSCLPGDDGEPADPLEGELCLDGNFALPEEAFPGEEAAVLLVGLFPAVARLLVGLLPAVTLLLVGLLPALTLLLPVGPIDLREERFDPVKLEDDVGLPVYVVSSSMRKPRGAGDDDRTLHTRTHTHTHTRTHTHTHKHIYIYIYICVCVYVCVYVCVCVCVCVCAGCGRRHPHLAASALMTRPRTLADPRRLPASPGRNVPPASRLARRAAAE
eukprot:GHVU01223273.1.p1 GENE.GHVU01223273.1~~GHVU01223273.1.p1  ORF type:complete len:219 (+),score=24.92 GHVU01223273.1:204-860(+)